MNRKIIIILICFSTVLWSCSKEEKTDSIVASSPVPAESTVHLKATYVHPGMLHKAADFTRMIAKVNAGTQPWKGSWDLLVASSFSSSTYTMKGPVATIIRGAAASGAAENYSKVMNDAAAAYQNALRWKIAGTTANATKAIEILNAWANTCTDIDGDSNQSLASGLYGYQLANAAEIMRTYSGWAAADITKFKTFLINVFYYHSNDFLVRHHGTCDTHYWANWDLCNMATILAIGIFCDDAAKVNQAVYYFKSGVGNGMIGKLVPFAPVSGLAQCQESGRDQGHTLLDISLIGAFCEMAWNQGIDLYSYNPWSEATPRVQAMCEYVAKYNLGNSVSFSTYTNCEGETHTAISATGRGGIRPCWELIHNHFVNRLGKSMPYTTSFAQSVRPEGGGGNYGTTSGGFDQLGFGTLTELEK